MLAKMHQFCWPFSLSPLWLPGHDTFESPEHVWVHQPVAPLAPVHCPTVQSASLVQLSPIPLLAFGVAQSLGKQTLDAPSILKQSIPAEQSLGVVHPGTQDGARPIDLPEMHCAPPLQSAFVVHPVVHTPSVPTVAFWQFSPVLQSDALLQSLPTGEELGPESLLSLLNGPASGPDSVVVTTGPAEHATNDIARAAPVITNDIERTQLWFILVIGSPWVPARARRFCATWGVLEQARGHP